MCLYVQIVLHGEYFCFESKCCIGVLSFNGDREALVHLYVERHLIVGTLLMGKTDEERMLIHFVVISRIFKGRVKGMIALRGAAGSMSDLYMVSKIKKK